MSIPPGSHVGPYEILAVAGAGGMGVVYKARDPRLGRIVAIKVLPEERAEDADRRRRFIQEARAASALNHPHILSVFDTGASEGREYLVTEFIDGWNLREWAQSQRPSTVQILDILSRIADALATAHAAGIVHRDIKPENILVARQGYPKLVDFGLAKVREPASADTQTPTRTVLEAQTVAGLVVGTVAYMSPEQASGRPADARSDIFSLGLVLYELFAARKAFAATSDIDLLYAIIHNPHRPLAEVRPDLPLPITAIVEKSLEKEPADRYQYARELATDLRRAMRVTSAAPAPSRPRPRGGPRWAFFAAAALGLLLAFAAGAWWRTRGDAWQNPLASARFTRFTDFPSSEADAVISPDGKLVGFLSDHDGGVDAWIGQIGSSTLVNLTKGQFPELLNDQVRNITFSPDSANLVAKFNEADSTGRLVRTSSWMMPVIGGPSRRFIDGLEMDWSPDGRSIVYHGTTAGDPIFVAARDGSNPRQIYVAEPGSHCHYTTWSLDGRYIYFSRGLPKERGDLWRIPAVGGAPERLTFQETWVEFPTPFDEHTLLYLARESNGAGPWLYAMDLQRRAPHRVALGAEQYLSVSAARNANGRVIRLAASVANPSSDIWTVPITDRVIGDAEAARVPLSNVRAQTPRFGKDYVLYVASRGNTTGLWKYKDGAATELWNTTEDAITTPPAVSPDGRQIALRLWRRGVGRLYTIAADGADLRAHAPDLNVIGAPAWSPDGASILTGGADSRGSGLFRVPLDGSPIVRLADSAASTPVWSPDGSAVLFHQPLAGIRFALKILPIGQTAVRIPETWMAGSRDGYHFLPDGSGIVLMLGELHHSDFWLLNLKDGRMRRLTNLKPGFTTRGFDISADGKQIIFDRIRDNSDVVVIDLP